MEKTKILLMESETMEKSIKRDDSKRSIGLQNKYQLHTAVLDPANMLILRFLPHKSAGTN